MPNAQFSPFIYGCYYIYNVYRQTKICFVIANNVGSFDPLIWAICKPQLYGISLLWKMIDGFSICSVLTFCIQVKYIFNIHYTLFTSILFLKCYFRETDIRIKRQTDSRTNGQTLFLKCIYYRLRNAKSLMHIYILYREYQR